MTSPFESRLRDGLRQLAQAPPAPALADRALAGARRARRRRRSLAALAAVAVVGIGTATPLLLTTRGGPAPVGAPQTVRPPVECQTATNEAVPPGDAVPEAWPSFVGIVLAHLPPRDDYHLDIAVGICEQPGSGRSGRMVMGIGVQDEHGQFVVELIGDSRAWLTAPYVLASSTFDPSTAVTCPALRAQYPEVYVCEDATEERPLAFAGVDARGDMYVFAYYPDGRWIILENDDSMLELATMLAIVTDPALAALLR